MEQIVVILRDYNDAEQLEMSLFLTEGIQFGIS